MRVVRFMSATELRLYLQGKTLRNGRGHNTRRQRSTSVGFTFAELTKRRDADHWYRKFAFTADCVYAVELDTERCRGLTASVAEYIVDDPPQLVTTAEGRLRPLRQEFREWCVRRYSRYSCPYTRIGRCPPTLKACLLGDKIEWLTDGEVRTIAN